MRLDWHRVQRASSRSFEIAAIGLLACAGLRPATAEHALGSRFAAVLLGIACLALAMLLDPPFRAGFAMAFEEFGIAAQEVTDEIRPALGGKDNDDGRPT